MHEILFLDSQLSTLNYGSIKSCSESYKNEQSSEQPKVSSLKTRRNSNVQVIIPNFSVISLNNENSCNKNIPTISVKVLNNGTTSETALSITNDETNSTNSDSAESNLTCNLLTDDEQDSNASILSKE